MGPLVLPPPLPPTRGYFDHPDMKLHCLDVWIRTPGPPPWSVRAFLQEGCASAWELAPRYRHRPRPRAAAAHNVRLKLDMQRLRRLRLRGPSMLRKDLHGFRAPVQVDCSCVDP